MIWPFRPTAPARASRVAIKPPAPSAQQAPLALVLIARNEARTIGDWLAFHALAGVSHVYLYDNGSTDRTVQIAKGFTGCAVTVIPWCLDSSEARTGMILPRQIVAYAHAICTFGGGYRRMGFIDADEYLVARDHAQLTDALETMGTPNLSLPWAMFGHGGHDASPDDALPFAYQQRARQARGALLNFKCIINPCQVVQVSTHKFQTTTVGAQTANSEGMLAPNNRRKGAFVTHAHIQLNHYYLQSKADMQAKIDGPAVSGTAQAQRAAAIRQKAALIEADLIQDDTAPAFLARHNIYNSADLRARFGGQT